MWKPVSEIPSWNDFPVVVVTPGNGSAHMMIIDEARGVRDMPPVLFYPMKSWDLICQWHDIVAWKSLEFHQVNQEAGCYVNTDPHVTWT